MAARTTGVAMINGKTVRPIIESVAFASMIFLLVAAALTMTFMLVMNALAQAPKPGECPPAATACKIITLTPDEENTLSGAEMLFDHALWANRVKFDSMLQAWREKLKQAPAGIVKPAPPESGKKQDKLPSGSPASSGETKK